MKPRCFIIYRRLCLSTIDKSHLVSKSYESMAEQRYMEAGRTAFIVHPASPKNLYDYADRFGKILNFYTFKRTDKHYALIEYQNLTGVQKLIQSARHFPNEHRIPYSFGKCFYFHATASQNLKRAKDFSRRISNVENRLPNDGELLNCPNIDRQMMLLHKQFSMSELDIRLKYFLASEVEAAAKCIFPDSKVFLFGSSVNGFGRFNGDADMMLKIEKDNPNKFNSLHNHTLYHMSRIRPEEARQFSRHILDVIGGILAHITPQMMNVRRILKARVPIVKFIHSPTEIECDICLNNDSAIEMSRILFKLIRLDSRFCMLVFTLRQWARCNHVISAHPGPWLTNFMLTMLVLFRFQNLESSLLPPLNKINSKNFKFDIGNLSNDLTLEYLLVDFFNFYANFNFEDKGISLLNGACTNKPNDSTAIYMENPLEPELNICKNVDAKHLHIFKDACSTALRNLNSSTNSNKFGILNILSLVDPTDDVLWDNCEFYLDAEKNKEPKNEISAIERTV